MKSIHKITVLSLGILVLSIAPAAASTDTAASQLPIVAEESQQLTDEWLELFSATPSETPSADCGSRQAAEPVRVFKLAGNKWLCCDENKCEENCEVPPPLATMMVNDPAGVFELAGNKWLCCDENKCEENCEVPPPAASQSTQDPIRSLELAGNKWLCCDENKCEENCEVPPPSL